MAIREYVYTYFTNTRWMNKPWNLMVVRPVIFHPFFCFVTSFPALSLDFTVRGGAWSMWNLIGPIPIKWRRWQWKDLYNWAVLSWYMNVIPVRWIKEIRFLTSQTFQLRFKGSVHSEFLIFVMIKCVFLTYLRIKTMTCYKFSVRPTIPEYRNVKVAKKKIDKEENEDFCEKEYFNFEDLILSEEKTFWKIFCARWCIYL